MILHDQCHVTLTEKLDNLDSSTPRVVEYGEIPCEVNPIETEIASDSGPITIRYRFVTTEDLSAIIDDQAAAWKADDTTERGSRGADLTLTYDGKTITPEAGYERHKMLGRFHHIEAVMQDFGATGA